MPNIFDASVNIGKKSLANSSQFTKFANLLDTTITSNLSNDNIEKLSLILTKLQTVANTFDDLQVNEHNSSCTRLTPEDSKTIYRYIPQTNASLLRAVYDMAKYWFDSDKEKYDFPGVLHAS